MKYKKKKTKGKSQSQSQSSVPKQFKTNEFQNGTFLRPSSYYKYRGDNLQHSVVNNNETQSRNSRAVALSTNARLRFNSSMSLLLGAFDLVYLRSNWILTDNRQVGYVWWLTTAIRQNGISLLIFNWTLIILNWKRSESKTQNYFLFHWTWNRFFIIIIIFK